MKIYLTNDNTGGYKKGGAALKIMEMKSSLMLKYFYDKNNLPIVVGQIILNKIDKEQNKL